MTHDDLVRLDNKPDNKMPKDLLDLINNRPIYVTSLKRTNTIRLEQSKVAGNTISFDLKTDFVVGQIGKSMDNFVRSKTTTKAKELEPYIPNWRGIEYHPKISGQRPPRKFENAKGRRIQPLYIFGPDDRVIYYPSGYPWNCIGQVMTWENPEAVLPSWTGTGTLVGKNVVVTASHLCPWENNSNPWKMQFVPGYYDGSSVSGSGVSSYVETFFGYKNHSTGDDMAVLKLFTPLGNSLGYLGSKTYDSDWDNGWYWTKCGYPGMLAGGQRPSRIISFPILDEKNDGAGVRLEMLADATPGDSGGPIFGWWDNQPYIVGVTSSEEGTNILSNGAAGGEALANLIEHAISTW